MNCKLLSTYMFIVYINTYKIKIKSDLHNICIANVCFYIYTAMIMNSLLIRITVTLIILKTDDISIYLSH